MEAIAPHGRVLSIPEPRRYRRRRVRQHPPNTEPVEDRAVPLCVDLDGTVIRSDLLWEGLVRFCRRNPLNLIRILLWWRDGRARLKAELARRVSVPVETLPVVTEFLDFLQRGVAAGRALYLVTASDAEAARRVAAHWGLFRETLASDGRTNLRSHAKAARLVERFGAGGFDYAGNSMADLPVWRQARRALVVNAPRWLVRRAHAVAEPGGTFACPPRRARALWRALRPRAWTKNLLVFAPLLVGGISFEASAWIQVIWAAVGLSLCASAVYLWDDLMDLDADRADPCRRGGPVASGHLPLAWAAAMVPVLGGAGVALASLSGPSAAGWVGLYLLLAGTWSWRQPQKVRLRPWVRAGFLLMRLGTGHAAAGVPLTTPLLGGELLAVVALAWWNQLRGQCRTKTFGPSQIGRRW